MNIILVVSDTFRRDHLPCYGNSAMVTPNLDKFAENSLIFEDFYAASFPTVPCRADMMTGRYTFAYLPWGPLPQKETVLADCLRKAGYVTAAVADTPFLMRNGYAQDRGFQEFIYIGGQIDGPERDSLHAQRGYAEDAGYCAPRTFKEAADWLARNHDEKFFLYIDTWDPHEPWDPPEYYVKPYTSNYKGKAPNPSYWDYKEDGLTKDDVDLAHACYCGEISMVDFWFGFLMERLRVLNLEEDTVVIFTSDHGFSFGEHGLFGKRRFRWPVKMGYEEGFTKGYTVANRIIYRSPLHNEITRIPLLMHIPGQAARRIPGLVSIPDLMPTLLDMAGVEIPQSVQAKSMFPLIEGKVDQLHDFVVTSVPFEDIGQLTKTVDDFAREVAEISPGSITDGEWDMLYSVHGQAVELYRTREDPKHLNNVYGENREVAQQLHAKYVAWLKQIGTADNYLEPRSRI